MTDSSLAQHRTVKPVCITRPLKNLERLQKIAPHLFTEHGKQDFTTLVSYDLLKILHTEEGKKRIKAEPRLSDILKSISVLGAGLFTYGPLFSGTIYIVQPRFTIYYDGNLPLYVGDDDMATILNYATNAVQPISTFAGQYGKNKISVHPQVLEYPIPLDSAYHTSVDVTHWVSGVKSMYNLPQENSCVAFIIPQGIRDINLPPARGFGYHAKAEIPFMYVTVEGENFTIEDRDNHYAECLSHEIAELVVDPNADYENPEVCDPCASNCNNEYLVFFDQNLNYIKTALTYGTPRDFPYYFFIAAVVQPHYAYGPPPYGCIPLEYPAERLKACSYGFPLDHLFKRPRHDRPLPWLPRPKPTN
ncbi:MAG TPA: hypothetical protein VFI06_00610 [Chitinophagaceae bacterium]|nr:hypothetical protein [Chitinophagaceae bacterium]